MKRKSDTDGIRKVTRTFWGVVRLILRYFAYTFVLALLYYTVFALSVHTDTERALHRENTLFKSYYPLMTEREKLIEDVINGIQIKDRQVYADIFYAHAPELDPVATTDFFAATDSISDRDIIEYTSRKADMLFDKMALIEEDFLRVAEVYGVSRDSLPPLSMPLDSICYAQVGASLGDRLNPFYKVNARHDGLDIIAPQGYPVRASADGVVTLVRRSFKGEGNVVEITHKGGYVTRYCHLADITVGQGQQLRKGRKIAEVGMSGNSLVPHLHYEVLRNGTVLDPVQYLFASVSPDEYANMLYMSVNTGQSLD